MKKIANKQSGNKLKFAQVEFLDAEDTAGWVKKSKLPKPPVCISCGWIVKHTKQALYLAASVNPRDKEIGTIMQIPLGCIVRIKKQPTRWIK